ncbi:sulfotransferase family protein [Flindersiella endophytica]
MLRKLERRLHRTATRFHRYRREIAIPAADRLVAAPVFIICSVRSGSTLLRCVLNSHSRIHAPHELHLRWLQLDVKQPYAETSVELLGLDKEQLEHLLWDRLLHRELVLSGKSIVVDKTPSNSTFWPRLAECWPNARYIFLTRHPGSIFESLRATHPDRADDVHARAVLGHLTGVDEAKNKLPGHVVRYEDLTTEPERVTRDLCTFLGVDWERRMLDYGSREHGPFRPGVGDWSANIRSGEIRAPRPAPEPDSIPELLHPIARTWGYL